MSGAIAPLSRSALAARRSARLPCSPAAMIGTLINVGAVVAGTAIGTTVGTRLPARVQQRVLAGLGLILLVMGVDLALAWGGEGTKESTPLFVLGGILLGGIVGEAIGIERRLGGLGDRAQARLTGAGGHSTLSEGFVTASLLFCVGSLAVLGPIQDGLTGDYQTLATKAVLDGFAAVALAATLGWGVGLSAVSVLAVQGTITLAPACSRTSSSARRLPP
jgi:uncharacterized membrane protein YqgA involved in biofilm formation